ncbi:hypothetical protein HYU13_03650 [Candidatus Woesearchaeota archaeon]|nr:hypothetical protein [Candidatus Woesearchaeota archaeon]
MANPATKTIDILANYFFATHFLRELRKIRNVTREFKFDDPVVQENPKDKDKNQESNYAHDDIGTLCLDENRDDTDFVRDYTNHSISRLLGDLTKYKQEGLRNHIRANMMLLMVGSFAVLFKDPKFLLGAIPAEFVRYLSFNAQSRILGYFKGRFSSIIQSYQEHCSIARLFTEGEEWKHPSDPDYWPIE